MKMKMKEKKIRINEVMDFDSFCDFWDYLVEGADWIDQLEAFGVLFNGDSAYNSLQKAMIILIKNVFGEAALSAIMENLRKRDSSEEIPCEELYERLVKWTK